MMNQRIFPVTGPEEKQVMDGVIYPYDTTAFKDAFSTALNIIVNNRKSKVPMIAYENNEGHSRFSITYTEHKNERVFHLPDSILSAIDENCYEIEFINKSFDKFIKDLKQGVATP